MAQHPVRRDQSQRDIRGWIYFERFRGTYCATQHGPVEDQNLRQRQRSRSRRALEQRYGPMALEQRARVFPMALNYDADVDIPMPALDLEDWRGVRKHWTLEEEIDLMRSVAGDQVDDGQGQDVDI